MKTKSIFALLTALLLSAFSIQAAGLIDESNLLLGSTKKCAPLKVAKHPIIKVKMESKGAAADEVQVKLFNADGELVGQQTVTMEEFMAGDFTRNCLPVGTTFVMFHGQIAYFQTNTDGAAISGV